MQKIYLRLVIIEGKKYIVDQDGREVDGVTRIGSRTASDEIDTIDISVYEMRADGSAIVSGGHK